jgi:hypothetical protein
MKRYRTRLRDVAGKRGVRVGKGPLWINRYGC